MHCALSSEIGVLAKDVWWLEASQHNGTRGKDVGRSTLPSSVSNAVSRSALSLLSADESSQLYDLPKVEPPFPR